MMEHLLIPDGQVKPGVPLDHWAALGEYIVEKKPDTIINIGDFADIESLNSHEEKGSVFFEGKRYKDDIQVAHEAMELLLRPMWEYNKMRAKNGKKQYKPRMVLTLGNHEHRIKRATDRDPKLIGLMSVDDLKYTEFGWEVHPFTEIVKIDGIAYCHYFVNPRSLKKNVIGGTIDNMLDKLGSSFSMGHQQTLKYGIQYYPDGSRRQGLVAGAFYQHDEGYMGVQGNASHWRGVVYKHEVRDGTYDPMFLSMNYLLNGGRNECIK